MSPVWLNGLLNGRAKLGPRAALLKNRPPAIASPRAAA
jgi:hypothetical protein